MEVGVKVKSDFHDEGGRGRKVKSDFFINLGGGAGVENSQTRQIRQNPDQTHQIGRIPDQTCCTCHISQILEPHVRLW